MRIISMLMLMMLMACSVSAEVLMTADPIGQGKYSVNGVYFKDAKINTTGIGDLSTYGVNLGYGLTDKLDLYLNLSSASVGGFPPGFSLGFASYGLSAQYLLAKAGESMPFDLAGKLGVRSVNVTASVPIVGNPVSQYLASLEISKKVDAFTPYFSLGYLQSQQTGYDPVSQVGITLGSAYAWAANSSVMLEFTQNTTSAGSQSYTNSQFGGGLSFIL
ncbi:MAG: hypothetical protein WC500_06365 [Candidatus Margulisiibacteriota bacterium]